MQAGNEQQKEKDFGQIHKYYVCLVQMWRLHWTVFKSWTLQPHVIQQRAVLWEFSSATSDYCD